MNKLIMLMLIMFILVISPALATQFWNTDPLACSSEAGDYLIYELGDGADFDANGYFDTRGDTSCTGGICQITGSNSETTNTVNSTLMPVTGDYTIETGFKTIGDEGVSIISFQNRHVSQKTYGTPLFGAWGHLDEYASIYFVAPDYNEWNGMFVGDAQWHNVSLYINSTTIVTLFNKTNYIATREKTYTGIDANEHHIERGHFGMHVYATTQQTLYDFIVVYEGTDCPAPPPPTFPYPVISNVNCTSNPDGDITDPYNSTGDLTPTFVLDTDIDSNCGISDTNGSWTTGTTTGGTSHILTLPFEKAIACGDNQKVYANCSRTDGLNETYVEWNVWACDAAPSGGDTQELIQYIEVANYTDTNITYNRTFVAINFYTVEKSFNIPALDGWTLIDGADPIVVASQSTGKSVYQNVSIRGDDDEWFDLAAVTATATSNILQTILPVDPPFKSCIFKTDRTLSGITLDCDTMQVWDEVELKVEDNSYVTTDRIEIADTNPPARLIIDDTSRIN